MYVCLCMYGCMSEYAYMCLCMYVLICVCMYMSVHTSYIRKHVYVYDHADPVPKNIMMHTKKDMQVQSRVTTDSRPCSRQGGRVTRLQFAASDSSPSNSWRTKELIRSGFTCKGSQTSFKLHGALVNLQVAVQYKFTMLDR